MLRTYAPGGHVPLWRGPLQLQPEAPEKPRQNIVDIVQQCESTPGVTTFLYEIRRQRDSVPNRGTAFVARSPNKEKLRRIELKVIHNNENIQPQSFPIVEKSNARGNFRSVDTVGEKQISLHQHIHEPVNQTRDKLVNEKKSRPKSVRFSVDQSKPQDPSGSSSPLDSKSSSKKTDLSCEVRGSAIRVDKSRTPSPSHVRAADAIRRQNSFQSSLQLFRRRLRLNQEKFIQAAITRENEDDCVTRQSKPERQQTVIYPSPPQEPRQAPPQSSRPRLRVKYPQLNRKQHQNVTETYDPDAKCSYRLQDSKHKSAATVDRGKTPIANVKTYVLEDNNTRTEHILLLTTHNLAVHQSLLSKEEDTMVVGKEELTCEPRFLKWIRESNNQVQLQHKKTVKFEVFGKRVGTTDSCSAKSLSNRSHSDHGL